MTSLNLIFENVSGVSTFVVLASLPSLTAVALSSVRRVPTQRYLL